MKLFLFILLSLIFINGTKSELNTTTLSISIYNNDFELFENIIEREKRESNKEENDNNSKDPINENKQNDNNSKKEIQPKTKEDIIQNDNKNDDTNNSKSPVNQDKNNNNNGKSELTNSKNKKPTKNNLKRILKRLKKLKKKILNRKNTNNNERPQIQDINERPKIKDINKRPKIEAFKVNGQTFLRCKRGTRGTPGSSCDKSLDDDGFTVVKYNNPKQKHNIQFKLTKSFENQFNGNSQTKTQIIDRVNLIRKEPNFEKLADQEVRGGDFGIHKMEKGSKLEGYFTADFKKGESARILMRYNDDTIEVYGLVDTHNTDKSGKKLPEKNVITEKELKNIGKSDSVYYNNVANSNKYLKVKNDKNQHVYVKLYEKPIQKISKY